MAVIEDTNGNQLLLGATSKGARGELYDAAGNQVATVDGATLGATQGGLQVAGQDDGIARGLRVGRTGSVGEASSQPLFWEDFEGAVLNTARWVGSLTTFTVAQSASTGLTVNATTATSAVAVINSARRFDRRLGQGMDVAIRARVSAVTNSIAELGLGDTTNNTVAIVNNAALFRYAGTSMTAVISYNGTEITGTPVDMSTLGGVYLDYAITMNDLSVVFQVRNSQTGAVVTRQTLRFPNAQAKAFATTRLPLMFRVYNGGVAPSAAPIFGVSSVSVSRLDDATAAPLGHVMAGLHLASDAIPATGQSNASLANSSAPGAATLSNTAAGYTTCGGAWQFVAVAGAETDYALFGYQVPSPFGFVVTGVRISTFVTGAAIATTPTLLQWALGINSTAVSLATTTAAPTAQAANRVPLGTQSLAVGAVPGTSAPDLDVGFEAPFFIGAGRFLQVILRMPVATATASQSVRGMCLVRGYFV